MRYNQIEVEQEMQKFWDEKQIYSKVKEKNKNGENFYFLDGPPYTSGKVHIGTAWNKSLKDCVLRYKRMRGFNVWDRAGYDMHGLPTELKVQDKLGMKHKDQIEEFGVQKFVEECRRFSTENMKIMNVDFSRLGVWMDLENAYTPISKSFVNGEWWLVKKAHEGGRLYEGEKTMHWCATCATALAKHELEYKNVKDNSIFVKFKVKGKENEYFIIWTTTPWTLLFNSGIMVNPELDYIRAQVDNEVWIVAKGLAGVFIQGVAGKDFKIIEEFKGDKLKGLEYEHFLDELNDIYSELKAKAPNFHTVVLSKEFVDLSAGTGLVHMAPGCGPEDYEVGLRNGIPPFNNLNEEGVFPEEMKSYSGMIAKKDDAKFIEMFDNKGVLIASNEVEHDYAHCWRCHKGVIFRTTTQWFFKIEDLKEKMKEINKEIYWNPESAKVQFHNWLDNIRDNGITRQRYWGTPLPVWKCECGKYTVIGSIEELHEKAGKLPEDFHKPWIDEIKLPCECGKEQKRIPDILDVWIDAGTTSWNCLDYPNTKENFNRLFPADFILEGKDQIRGWFNLLLVASMISMGKPSFKNVYMHGFVQDAQGRKMSKSVGNVISPYEVIDKHGADVLRYYMIGGADPGVDINYNFEDLKVKARNLGILWNLHKYLLDLVSTYNLELKEDGEINNSTNEEDYIISRMNSAIKQSSNEMDNYSINALPKIVEELFLDLSRKYIQYVREKIVYKEDQRQKIAQTIFNVILNSLKMFAPVAPFITEAMYQNFKKKFNLEKESIHLYSWPNFDEGRINEKLEMDFSAGEKVMQHVFALREKAQLGVRWPVLKIIINGKEEFIESVKNVEEILKKQLNVKEISYEKPEVKVNIRLDYNKLKEDYGELTPKIIAQFAMESKEAIIAHIEERGQHDMMVVGAPIVIKKEHLLQNKELDGHAMVSFAGGEVFMDLTRNAELDAEGFAREIMRRVQQVRKNIGLLKVDRINLKIVHQNYDIHEELDKYVDSIAEKCGADKIELTNQDSGEECSSEEKIKGKIFKLFVSKV